MDEKQALDINDVFELKVSMQPAQEAFQCTLCPGHVDDNDVAWSTLLDDLICRGCTYDIHNGFIDWEEQPRDDQYNHADTIQRIINITGRSFHHLKYLYMREQIVEWGGTVPESCLGELTPGFPEAWLKGLNKQMDQEFHKIYEKNRNVLYDDTDSSRN